MLIPAGCKLPARLIRPNIYGGGAATRRRTKSPPARAAGHLDSQRGGVQIATSHLDVAALSLSPAPRVQHAARGPQNLTSLAESLRANSQRGAVRELPAGRRAFICSIPACTYVSIAGQRLSLAASKAKTQNGFSLAFRRQQPPGPLCARSETCASRLLKKRGEMSSDLEIEHCVRCGAGDPGLNYHCLS